MLPAFLLEILEVEGNYGDPCLGNSGCLPRADDERESSDGDRSRENSDLLTLELALVERELAQAVGRARLLYLPVILGFGSESLMLLMTEDLSRSFKCLWRWVRAYMRRWSIEETIRYVKTCYDVENVRAPTCRGLQNLMPLVLAVMYFAACILDHEQRLRIMAEYVEKADKRLFGIPEFKYYALSDGLRSLFTRHPGKPERAARSPGSPQMESALN